MNEDNSVGSEVVTAGSSEQVEPIADLAVAKASSTGLVIEKLFLPIAILVAAVMISGTLLYTSKGGSGIAPVGGEPIASQAPIVDVSIDDDPMLGNPNAKVTMIEFSDFQCPFCRKFWTESFAVLKKEYIDTGKVRLVFRDYPLQFHPAAQISAEASQCAFEQGKYWEFHDKMFEEQAKLGDNTITYGATELKKWAKDLGLDTLKFNTCVDSKRYTQEVDKDTADGTAAGVTGTPSFFINGKMIVGSQPYSVFKAALDEALKAE